MRELRLIGASIRGEAHAARGTYCEDAFARRSSADFAFVAVADGVGSCEFARDGARAAVRAASDAAALWRGEQAQVTDVLKLLHASWRLRLHPRRPSEAAATCLFAAARAGVTLLAQLGDGAIVYTSEEGACRLDSDERQFGNETVSLAGARSVTDWSTAVLPYVPGTVLLASDGVSDDLEPNTETELLSYFEELVNSEDRLPAVRLSQDLRNWPTPGATDDRTIAGWARRVGESNE